MSDRHLAWPQRVFKCAQCGRPIHQVSSARWEHDDLDYEPVSRPTEGDDE